MVILFFMVWFTISRYLGWRKWRLNQHLFKVTSKKVEKWFYYLATKFHLEEFIRIADGKKHH